MTPIRQHKSYVLLFVVCCLRCVSQIDSNTVIRFDFNEHQFKEAREQLKIKAIGASLADDRFGNNRSAAYLNGDAESYLNLGTSNLLKPVRGTVSLWVNIQSKNYFGQGYPSNPFIIAKNAPGEDYILAYSMDYNQINSRLNACLTKDSVEHVIVSSNDQAKLNTWYHMVIAFDDHWFTFYINGEQKIKMKKTFKTFYWEGDSVLMGRTVGTKNMRYAHCIVDDIQIFHKMLNEKEIKALYNEPNPNQLKNILYEILKYGVVILIACIIIVLLVIRNRRNLRRQKEYYELNNKVQELEIKVIRAQMNPHFISNCLAAIQNLIYNKEIDNAAQYLAKFNALLRHVLDYSDMNFITLYEELKIIELNVELEQLRFSNNFTFSMDIENGIDLKTVLVPSLISQPFIENAIWHGLLPLKIKAPQLKVSVFRKEDYVYLSIEDNGIGRTKHSENEKKSRGVRLAADKLESMNRTSNTSDYRLEIIDLFDGQGNAAGTKIIIRVSHLSTEL